MGREEEGMGWGFIEERERIDGSVVVVLGGKKAKEGKERKGFPFQRNGNFDWKENWRTSRGGKSRFLPILLIN